RTQEAEQQAHIQAGLDRGRAIHEARDRQRQYDEAIATANTIAAQRAVAAHNAAQVVNSYEAPPVQKPAASAPSGSSQGMGSWQAAGVSTSTNSNTASTSGNSKLIATPEAIIVCTIPSATDGRFNCSTPITKNISGGPENTLSQYRSPELMVASMSAACPGAAKLRSSSHLVWGCGFGATNNSAQMDRSAGVDVHGRETYYCYPKEVGCKRTSP